MKPDGMPEFRYQVATQKAANTMLVMALLLTKRPSNFLYLQATRPNQSLKPLRPRVNKFLLFFPCVFLSSAAQRAGVSVNATNPDITIEVDMVMENWR